MSKPLKIVFITEMYSEGMGYSENFLPRAVAKLGYEVHVIASTAQIYYSSPAYKETYEPFLGPNIVSPGAKEIDGYMLHRLPLKHTIRKNMIRLKGLESLLRQLSPDIIQAFNIYSLTCYDAALAARLIGARFFTESHVHASVFDMSDGRTRMRHWLLGFPRKLKTINDITEKHYAIAKDVAQLSLECFGVPPEKMEIQSLGVDTDLFTPPLTGKEKADRIKLRKEWDIQEDDILCIYTGRFTKDKNPLCLARAIDYIQQNGYLHCKALFVGSGTPDDVAAINMMKGCKAGPFVKVNELPFYYRAADIGVWPRQESMSQLDAVACGLPIIISDRAGVKERVEGNGFLYKEDDHEDLARKILQLTDDSLRKEMAVAGPEKIKRSFSWDAIARKRVRDFEQSMGRIIA